MCSPSEVSGLAAWQPRSERATTARHCDYEQTNPSECSGQEEEPRHPKSGPVTDLLGKRKPVVGRHPVFDADRGKTAEHSIIYKDSDGGQSDFLISTEIVPPNVASMPGAVQSAIGVQVRGHPYTLSPYSSRAPRDPLNEGAPTDPMGTVAMGER